MEKDWKHKHVQTHSPPHDEMERAPVHHQQAPVVVVQQAPPHSVVPQQVMYHEPATYTQPAPQVMQPIQPIQPPPQQYQQHQQYQQYQAPYQPPPQQQHQPQPVSHPYNPQAAAAPMQPGILVVNPSANQTESKMDNEPGTRNAEDKDMKQVAMEKGKAAAVATGKGAKKAGKAALGWMAKKINDLNDKVQDDKAAKQQEGMG